MNTDALLPSGPRCGLPIPPKAPRGLCPSCVLRGAAASTDGAESPNPMNAPQLESVRAAFPQLEIAGLIAEPESDAVRLPRATRQRTASVCRSKLDSVSAESRLRWTLVR